MNSFDADPPRRILPSMALLSTLSTAVQIHRGIRARRSGEDPSEQEAASTARSYLGSAVSELRLLLTRLRITVAAGDRDDVSTAAVRRFPQAMMLAQTARHLHRIHQRLMSLYPGVPESLVEQARLLHAEAEALPHLEPGRFESSLGPFIEQGLTFVDHLSSLI